MIDDVTLRRLEKMEATVCFSRDGDYVVTVSTGGWHREMGMIGKCVDAPSKVIIQHNGQFAQATGPDLSELVNVVYRTWLHERSAIVSLGELGDDDPS